MAKSKLNDQKPESVNINFLNSKPEEIPSAIPDDYGQGIVVGDAVPEMRHVRFLNGRDPGMPLEFHYHSKTHQLKLYKLIHDHVYDLPLEVVEHLESCKEPQYARRINAEGLPEDYICGYKYIFQCREVRNAA